MNIEIRFAEEKDFELVRRFDPHSEYIDPEKIRTKISSKEVILAFDKNTPVGMIKFSYFWGTRPYMDLIWVSENLRGQNIGSMMLAFFEKYLLENGHTYLYTSSQENEPAPQKWHQSHGFQKCGTLSALNLPHEETNEVFFYKHVANTDPQNEKLRTYPLL